MISSASDSTKPSRLFVAPDVRESLSGPFGKGYIRRHVSSLVGDTGRSYTSPISRVTRG